MSRGEGENSMIITIGGIGLPASGFTAAPGEAYGLFFDETKSAVTAIELAYSLLSNMGYRGDSIIVEHFCFQQDIGAMRLAESLRDATLRGFSPENAALVIPGLSPHLLGVAEVEEADIVAHLFELRRQLYAIGDIPCFVPFSAARIGNVSSGLVKLAAEAVGFIVCDVWRKEAIAGEEAGELGASLDEALRVAGVQLLDEATRIIDGFSAGGEE